MNAEKKLPKVKLIVAVTFREKSQLESVESYLTGQFGPVDMQSSVFGFEHMDYYEEEMGKGLSKVFFSFKRLISRENLPLCKGQTGKFETESVRDGKRTVNLDPGYIGEANLVLASTKNFCHRIYIAEGIFGDCHLVFEEGSFHPVPWTYPDYRDQAVLDFFGEVRDRYTVDWKSEGLSSENRESAYRKAGVDIDKGEEAVQRIKALAGKTYGNNVLSELGKFGGFYAPDWSEFEQPVLVSSVDGVGTKLKVAFAAGVHTTIGSDLVNHCINDILCCGARPLFFLDYLAFGRLDVGVFEDVVSGMADACELTGCALIGGETAEMPGFYREGEYDISGTIVGVVDKKNILDGSAIEKGDVILGLPSSGLHTNGYSLARTILFDESGLNVHSEHPDLDIPVGEELLKTHRCYYPQVYELISKGWVHGLAHITGGGIPGNIGRLLNSDMKMAIDWDSWKWPEIFKLLQELGTIDLEEMKRVFNLGIGMTVITSPDQVRNIRDHLKLSGLESIEMGLITVV
jgi:phosphoribosylformylglycinamidine cyclo-ligase